MKTLFKYLLILFAVWSCKSQTINYLNESQFANIQINGVSLNNIDSNQPIKSVLESYFGFALEENFSDSPNLTKEYWNDEIGIYFRFEDAEDSGSTYKLVNLKLTNHNLPINVLDLTFNIGNSIALLNSYNNNIPTKSYLFSVQETSAILEVSYNDFNIIRMVEYNLYN